MTVTQRQLPAGGPLIPGAAPGATGTDLPTVDVTWAPRRRSGRVWPDGVGVEHDRRHVRQASASDSARRGSSPGAGATEQGPKAAPGEDICPAKAQRVHLRPTWTT